MPTQTEQFERALRVHAPEFDVTLSSRAFRALADYYALLLKWNPQLHLVAPCSPEEFATRHVLESLLLLKHLPPNARVIDIGSGGGLPIVPCLLARDDLRATLVESSAKKSVFLREALRPVRPQERIDLIVARFEEIDFPGGDFVSCRALDRFSELLPQLIGWSAAKSTLLLFVGASLRVQAEGLLRSTVAERIPLSENRFLLIGGK